MRGQIIYKLSNLSIVPKSISISAMEIIQSQSFPLLKMEVYLNNLLLDQTQEITFTQKIQGLDNRVLAFSQKPFKYHSRELFGRSKVARLRLVLMRGNANWSMSQEIEVFNIVISEYSYEYCKTSFNQFQEHSVGMLKTAFFYYRVQCEYEEQKAAKQFSEVRSDQSNNLKPPDKEGSNSASAKKDINSQFLPLNSEADQQDQRPSDVFIDLKQMIPVYRDESWKNKKLRFKVQASDINAGSTDSQAQSVIQQTKKLKDSTSTICTALFYIYFITCLIMIVVQMSPEKKIKRS